MTLGVWFNGYDYVVAESEQDAGALCRESHGAGPDDDEYDGDGWQRLPDEDVIGVVDDDLKCSCLDDWDARCDRISTDFHALRGKLVAQGSLRSASLLKMPHVPRFEHVSGCAMGRVKKTCAEWVEINGKGFLCSTEY